MNLDKLFKELNIKTKTKPLYLIYDFDNNIIGFMNHRREFEELSDKDIKKIKEYLKGK